MDDCGGSEACERDAGLCEVAACSDVNEHSECHQSAGEGYEGEGEGELVMIVCGTHSCVIINRERIE